MGAFLAPLGALHAQDNFADQVVSYTTVGTGINTSYENASAALGAPTSSATITAPAYSNTQIVGIGQGAELTLGFNTPILNDPADHLGGMDFTIFGNEFFTLSGSTISGTFTHPGLTVWVSQDNVNYYELVAPYGADDSFPTSGTGDPTVPVSPSLSLSSFTGDTTSQALSQYNGSAGGASYSISWAEDSNGHAVNLPSVSYIEIVGNGGSGYVDAVSRVASVPEPADAWLLCFGVGVLLVGRRRWGRAGRKDATAIGATSSGEIETLSEESKYETLGLPAWCTLTENLAIRSYPMKKIIISLLLGAAMFSATTAVAQTFTFSNIQNWIGTGSNEAALVVDWNDGISPDPMVWGFRWSGTAPTVYGLLQDVEAGDSRFQFTADPQYPGQSVYSIYYDVTGLGGTPTVGTPVNLGGSENGHAPHPGDHYKEGWYTGFWGELIGDGNPYNGGSWDANSPQGVGIDTLTNNGWYAMSFSTDETNYTIPVPGTPAPEPSAFGLLSMGALGLFARRCRVLS